MAAVLNNLSPEINDRNIICIVSVLWPKLLLGDHWSRGRTGWRGQIVCSRNRNLCVRTTNNNAWCSNNRRSNFGHNSCIFVLPALFTQLVAVVTKRVIITPAKVIIITGTLIIAVQNWKKLVLDSSTNTGTESRHWPTVQIGIWSVLLNTYRGAPVLDRTCHEFGFLQSAVG